MIKAAQFGYLHKNAFLQLQEGFDPESLANVAIALRAQIIRDSIEASLREYDFLGGFTDHKKRWGTIRRIGGDFMIGHTGILSTIILRCGVWPTGKYLRPLS